MGKLKDLTGHRFGMLTVVRRYEQNDKYNKPLWVCNCDCGKKNIIVKGSALVQGHKWNCGCKNPTAFEDLTGKRFGHLTVINRADDAITKGGYHKIVWNCKCDCGNIMKIKSDSLRIGQIFCSPTCKYYPHHIEHGACKKNANKDNKRLYEVWCNMKERCSCPNSTFYEYYGGRGISVCDEWLKNYNSFREWSFNNGYNANLELGRIDNDGNYEPNNCHWVSHYDNYRNRRSTHWLNTPWGKLTTSEFARKMKEICGANLYTVKNLIYKSYMTVDEILKKYGVTV